MQVRGVHTAVQVCRWEVGVWCAEQHIHGGRSEQRSPGSCPATVKGLFYVQAGRDRCSANSMQGVHGGSTQQVTLTQVW